MAHFVASAWREPTSRVGVTADIGVASLFASVKSPGLERLLLRRLPSNSIGCLQVDVAPSLGLCFISAHHRRRRSQIDAPRELARTFKT